MGVRVLTVAFVSAFLTACSGSGSPAVPALSPNGASGASNSAATSISPKIVELSAGGDVLPQAITVANDGNPWFLTLHHVNRLSAGDGSVTSFVGPPAPQGSGLELDTYSPQNDITIGPDKAVWFRADGAPPATNPLGCEGVALVRIAANAPAGSTASLVGCPSSRDHGERFEDPLVAGPDGNIWTVDQNSAGLGEDGSQFQIVKLDGSVVLNRNLPAPCTEFAFFDPYQGNGIALGPDRAIYVSAGSPCGVPGGMGPFSSAVIRVDASGNITTVFPVTDAQRIATGPDGNLWVTQGSPTNAIARLSPSGAITEFALPTANAGPLGIAAGNDGAIWFAENTASKIGRITITGTITEFATPTPNAQPFGIASLAGACGPGHGLVWFTESRSNKIGKIEF